MEKTNIQNNKNLNARLIEDDLYTYSDMVYKKIVERYEKFSKAPVEIQEIWHKLNRTWAEIDKICDSMEDSIGIETTALVIY